jgi:hypothetical protein
LWLVPSVRGPSLPRRRGVAISLVCIPCRPRVAGLLAGSSSVARPALFGFGLASLLVDPGLAPWMTTNGTGCTLWNPLGQAPSFPATRRRPTRHDKTSRDKTRGQQQTRSLPHNLQTHHFPGSHIAYLPHHHQHHHHDCKQLQKAQAPCACTSIFSCSPCQVINA